MTARSTSGKVSPGNQVPPDKQGGEVEGTKSHRRTLRSRGELVEAYALPALLIVTIIVFSVLPATSETFPTSANMRSVLSGQAVVVLVALAVLVPVVTSIWDFTPGATAGISSIAAASVVSSTGSIPLAIAAAVGVGIAVGVVNSILITQFRINSVIATLGVTILISGTIQLMTNGSSIIQGIPQSLTDFGTADLFGVPALAWVALAFAVLIHYLLELTPFGRMMFAMGASRPAARLVGIPIERTTTLGLVLGGALAGCAGMLLLCQTGAGNPSVGPGFTLPAYATVFLGAVSIRPGRWNVSGLLVAILFLGTISSGLILSGASSWVTDYANGAALLIGMGLANLVARKRGQPIEMT